MSSYADKPRNAFGPASFSTEDIQAGRVHALSDPHFGHGRITSQAPRPGYAADGEHDTLQHEQLIVANWQRTVPADHFVLVGGDGAWNSSGINRVVEAGGLPGIVETLEGNHDSSGVHKALTKKLGWKFIDPVSVEWATQIPVKSLLVDDAGEPVLDEKGKTQLVTEYETHTKLIVITHYPIEDLPDGVLNLHGHIHNTQVGWLDPRYKDFSVESIGYGPLPLKGLLDALVIQWHGNGAGQKDAHEAETLRLALGNRVV